MGQFPERCKPLISFNGNDDRNDSDSMTGEDIIIEQVHDEN